MKKLLLTRIDKILVLGIMIGITSLTTVNTFANTKNYEFVKKDTNFLKEVKLGEYIVDKVTGLVFEVIEDKINPSIHKEKSVKFVGSIKNLDIINKIPHTSNFKFDSKQKSAFINLADYTNVKLIINEFDSNPKYFEFDSNNQKLLKTVSDMEIDEISIQAQKNIQEILMSKFIQIK